MLNYDIGIALGETSIHLASVEDPDPQDPRMFFGLPDPDPLVRCMDLDPDPDPYPSLFS